MGGGLNRVRDEIEEMGVCGRLGGNHDDLMTPSVGFQPHKS